MEKQSNTEISDFNRYLYPEFYNCYNADEIPSFIEQSNKDISTNYENSESIINVPEGPTQVLVGPMDSPWPMHCHDVRHTGRSPYNTINTWDEIWHVKDETYYMHSSPVISQDGTIYCGALNIYAINPNGTIKWKRDLDGYIWSAPAIDENGTIYFGVMYGSGKFYACNPNGTIKWKYHVGDSVHCSPAIDEEGVIYFGSDSEIGAVPL